MTNQIGVSGMAVFVPTCRVQLSDWCNWTGNNFDKVGAVVGRSFRMVAPHESVYTMAANAVLRLILEQDLDASQVGFLGFGTESSTDNSAGAVILKGMVDSALREMGRKPLNRRCEVPEFKHACLGGIYALKGALRYVATEPTGARAIVVSADMAEYERGSSGESTQGAGAVAMLVEAEPKLFAIDLQRCGSAASYRGPDFRKPQRRHFTAGYAEGVTKMHDFPVFNGKYSTTCYIDEVVHAVDGLVERLNLDHRTMYETVDGLFFHRPYHWMPVSGFGAMWVFGLARDQKHHAELSELCEAAGVELQDVLTETSASPELFDQVLDGRHGDEAYPNAMLCVKAFRKTATFKRLVEEKLSLGSTKMMDLGNLYTAALPAWIAAGLEQALEDGTDLVEKRFLAVGYGSGDAAEALLLQVVPGWETAAARIGLARSLEGAVDLSQEEYEALHDGHEVTLSLDIKREFVIDRIGEADDSTFQDVGIEYYRYVG